MEISDTAFFAEGDNGEWLEDPSLQKIILFFCHKSMRQTRKGGNVKEITHYIETASHSVVNGVYLCLPREVIAFTAFAHDLIEDNTSLSAKQIVDRCWEEGDKYKNYLIRTLNRVTDDPYLRKPFPEGANLDEEKKMKAKKFRLDSQTDQANADPTGLAALIRWSDKYATLVRDNNVLTYDNIPLGSVDEFRRYFTTRRNHLMQLNVPDHLKNRYLSCVQMIESTLEAFSPVIHRKPYFPAKDEGLLPAPYPYRTKNKAGLACRVLTP